MDNKFVLTKRHVEEWGPAFVAIVAGLGWYLFEKSIPSLFAKELLSALISSAAVGAGFLTAALSILMSLGATAIGRQLKRREKMVLLYSYLRSAIYSCLFLVTVCVSAFFSIDIDVGITTEVSSTVILFSVFCVASMARIIEILIYLFREMSESEDDSE